jgi:hypothetical protein
MVGVALKKRLDENTRRHQRIRRAADPSSSRKKIVEQLENLLTTTQPPRNPCWVD